MEVKREQEVKALAIDEEISFNPCFDGSEARVIDFTCLFLNSSVSILVLMEVKRERVSWPVLALAEVMFQSLF